MEKKAMAVLTPDFYEDFHCTAAACRSNCCVHPWAITIDKANYKKIRSLKEPRWLSESFGSYVKRTKNSTNDSDYARVVFGEHGCAFQTEEGLCRLQAEVGAEYLSLTCRSYPRLTTYCAVGATKDIQEERCLAISCEEVARILLHKPSPIQFSVSEQEYNAANFMVEHKHITNLVAQIDKRPITLHYNLIRAVGIALLQNRGYTVEQRLILLTLYLDKLSKAESEEKTDEIPAMTDIFVKAADEHLYDGLFDKKPIPEVSAMLTNFAAVVSFAGSSAHDIISRCDSNIVAVDYEVRYESYHAFLADKEHFLEHLLVTEFWGKALPFNSTRSIADCAQYLVSIYIIFRFMLGAYLGESRTISEVQFIDFVAFFGKEVLHTDKSFDRNIELLAKNKMNALPYLIALILG